MTVQALSSEGSKTSAPGCGKGEPQEEGDGSGFLNPALTDTVSPGKTPKTLRMFSVRFCLSDNIIRNIPPRARYCQ